MYGDFFYGIRSGTKKPALFAGFFCLSSKLFSTCKYASIADSAIGDRIVNAQ